MSGGPSSTARRFFLGLNGCVELAATTTANAFWHGSANTPGNALTVLR
jgi:hypothetical protein